MSPTTPTPTPIPSDSYPDPDPDSDANQPMDSRDTRETEQKDAKRTVGFVLGTWFGVGLIPLVPGTAGTAAAVPLYLLLRSRGPLAVLLVALALTLVGVWAADQVIAATGKKDPQIVVIDEVAGVLITLAAAGPSWASVAIGFVAFRVFDQFKPWPARRFERTLPGGWGVMMDDVAAGVWGAAVLLALRSVEWA